jgi:hypothetical protein
VVEPCQAADIGKCLLPACDVWSGFGGRLRSSHGLGCRRCYNNPVRWLLRQRPAHCCGGPGPVTPMLTETQSGKAPIKDEGRKEERRREAEPRKPNRTPRRPHESLPMPTGVATALSYSTIVLRVKVRESTLTLSLWSCSSTRWPENTASSSALSALSLCPRLRNKLADVSLTE